MNLRSLHALNISNMSKEYKFAFGRWHFLNLFFTLPTAELTWPLTFLTNLIISQVHLGHGGSRPWDVYLDHTTVNWNGTDYHD